MMRKLCSPNGICVFGLLLLSFVLSAVAQDKPKDKSKDKPKAAAPMPTPVPAPDPAKAFQSAITNLKFREIGPATMGGLIDDIAVLPAHPLTLYSPTTSRP